MPQMRNMISRLPRYRKNQSTIITKTLSFRLRKPGGETDFVPAEEVYDVPNEAAFEDVAQEASFSEESDPFWDNAAGEDVLIAEEPEQSAAETVAEDAPAEAQTGFSGTESSGWSWLDEQEDGEPIDLDAVYEPLPREEVQTASENADESDENWEWEYEKFLKTRFLTAIRTGNGSMKRSRQKRMPQTPKIGSGNMKKCLTKMLPRYR